MRLISHSEASSLLDCQAKHDFRYVGRLAGDALKPRSLAPQLRDGRAWGAGVAAHHQNVTIDATTVGHQAIDESLQADADEQEAAGFFFPDSFDEATERLHALLDHYAATTDPLPVRALERELEVPIPSRTGHKRSNAYRLQIFLDAVHHDDQGRCWIVEYKLRGRLTDFWQVALSRQIRWAAWAWRELEGVEPCGVIVDERLKEVPKPVRMLKGRGKDPQPTPSHAVDQMTTPELYCAACQEHDVEPVPATIEALASRRWQARHPVVFRPDELDEAGEQLVSVARQVHDFDSGLLYPVRNPSPARCPSCSFKEICAVATQDRDLVDSLFERQPAKKDREREVVTA